MAASKGYSLTQSIISEWADKFSINIKVVMGDIKRNFYGCHKGRFENAITIP